MLYILILQISLLFHSQFIQAQDNDDSFVQALRTVADCKIDPIEDEFHQFYDSTKLDCVNCDQNNTFQTATDDGKCLFSDLFTLGTSPSDNTHKNNYVLSIVTCFLILKLLQICHVSFIIGLF